MTALTKGVAVGYVASFGNALPFHTLNVFEEFRRV